MRLPLVRAATLEVYAAVRSEGHLADRALERVLRRESRLYSNERRAVAEAVYGMLRKERRLDFGLFGPRTPELPGPELFSLRFAALRVLEGDSPAATAAEHGISERWASLLSGVRAPLPADLSVAERVALEGSFPAFLAERLIAELGAEDALGFARAVGERGPLTVRTNALKGSREELMRRLAQEGVESRPTRFSPLGLTLESRINAFALGAFRDGLFEIQDEGSQLLAMLLGAQRREQVVDACAGAGGKTLALAADMGNAGELHALDIDARRLEELSRRARRAGVHNVRIRALPAGAVQADSALKGLAGRADRVLIDAPCTGLGAMRRNPDARYRMTPDDLDRYPALQRELLTRFAKLVRPGGRLVYATCSIAREENEAVVEAFLASGAPFRKLDAEALLPIPEASLLVRDGWLRLYPQQHGTDGFFAAALERTG